MKAKLIFILVLFFFQCKAQVSTLPLVIDLKVDKEYELTKSKSEYNSDGRDYGYRIKTGSVKQKYFDVTVKFTNTSDRKIGIWLMRCSFENNLLVNNNYIFIQGNICDKNFPSPVEFQPGESKDYKLTLAKSIKFDYPCEDCIHGRQVEETKIGLIVVDDFYNRKLNWLNYDLAMEDKSKWTIIWSNSLYLLGKQPEPIEIKFD